ncbi:MAG TPA: squalene/phytoene synthase family protein [Aestuariivirga sp.]|nr:squalene/phytoene synthase family protein [Aestuariivirga sp.]
MNTAHHCLELVRSADKDRFLASLFAPDAKRVALIALYAFNIEIARVRRTVSEPALGEIRYQWWRDTIAAIYRGETSPHPVAQELARAIKAGSLPENALLGLITAREFDLYDDPMPDVAALEGYLGETSSALIQMASVILAGPDARANTEAAGLAGVAYGIARLLGARNFMPSGFDAVAHAKMRLAEARALRPTISRTAFPAFLPVSLTKLYLSNPIVEISHFRRQCRMWWAARRERF